MKMRGVLCLPTAGFTSSNEQTMALMRFWSSIRPAASDVDEDAEEGGVQPEGGIHIGIDEIVGGDAAEAQPSGFRVEALQMGAQRPQIAHPQLT